MPTIETLGHINKRTHFSCTGNTHDGVILHFTNNQKITGDFFQAIMSNFRGRTIPGGFGMTTPSPDGLGEWVQTNSRLLNSISLTPRHASFIAAIMVHEGLITSFLEGNAVYLKFPKPID